MKPHIKILILNWNGKQLLKPCLDSVTSIDYPNYSIIVIDNGSSDGSIEMINKNYPNVDCFALDDNYGFSGGYNRYLPQLNDNESEFLLFLNNDTEVDSNILNNMNAARKKFGNDHIYGGKIYYRYNPELIWYAGGKVNLKWGHISHRGIRKQDSKEFSSPMQTDYITGCCLFTSNAVMKQLNGFDEQFNMYGEDVDLCLRAKKIGIKCFYWPQAKLWHHVSASLGGSYSISKILKKIKALIRLIRIHGSKTK